MSAEARIVLAGQGHWAKALATGLARYTPLRPSVAEFDTVSSALSLARWRTVRSADTLLLVGFRPGARTVRGRAFDLALSSALAGRNSRVIHYWIGSDVQRALADMAAGNGGRLAAVTAGREHFAGSEPLASDLATIGIEARVVGFPWDAVPTLESLPPLPGRFTVLTYIPDARPEFYGGPAILEAASRLPEARFVVMGGSGAWATDRPGNVEFAGWVEDTGALYADASAVVRLTQYDSIGGTAVEGLVYGRPVLYNHPVPHATLVQFGDGEGLADRLGELLAAHERGTLVPDSDAAAWAAAEFDPRTRFRDLAAALDPGAAS